MVGSSDAPAIVLVGPTHFLYGQRKDDPMTQTKGEHAALVQRRQSEKLRRKAVQSLLDEYLAVLEIMRLDLHLPSMPYRWKQAAVDRAGPAGGTLGERVVQLEEHEIPPRRTGKRRRKRTYVCALSCNA